MLTRQRLVFGVLGLASVLITFQMFVLAAFTAVAANPAQSPPRAAGSDEPSPTPELLRARTIEIVNVAGQPVIRLGVDTDGSGALILTSDDGTPLAIVGRHEGAGMMSTFDGAGHALVVLTERDGEGRVILSGDPAGE